MVMSPGFLLEINIPERGSALDGEVLLTLVVEHHPARRTSYLRSPIAYTWLRGQDIG